MNPQELFHEDFRDALRQAVKALGGYDTVGADLWPSKTRKAAGAWLSDCLNPERAAKLDLEEISQILRMARERGVHCAMHQLAEESGYAPPVIRPDRTPEQLLAEQMKRMVADLARLADEHAAIVQSNVTPLDRRNSR